MKLLIITAIIQFIFYIVVDYIYVRFGVKLKLPDWLFLLGQIVIFIPFYYMGFRSIFDKKLLCVFCGDFGIVYHRFFGNFGDALCAYAYFKSPKISEK